MCMCRGMRFNVGLDVGCGQEGQEVVSNNKLKKTNLRKRNLKTQTKLEKKRKTKTKQSPFLPLGVE